MLERVLAETEPRPPLSSEAVPRPEQLERLFNSVIVTHQEADTFAIEYVDSNPERAAVVPNRLAALLVEEAEQRRAERSAADPRLLEARLVEARTELIRREAALRALGPSERAALREPENAARERDRLEADKRDVAARLSAARARADRLGQAIEAERAPPADPPAPELTRLRAELAELRRRYTDEHPDVAALVRRIRSLETESVPQAEPSLTDDEPTLESQLAQVEAEIEALLRKEAATSVGRPGPTSQRDFEALARDYEHARSAFLKLGEELREAEIASRLRPDVHAQFVVLQFAAVPARPYFPNRVLFALVGLGLGLMLGFGVSLVAELRDDSVKGPEDLEEVLLRPLLTIIPEVRARGRRS